jgi:ornithine--oxo-acid transaminase
MIENAAEMGDYFLDGLRQIQNRLIKDVRGRGLMLAMQFWPDAGGARTYTKALMERGLLCKETHHHTIRFAPPLIIDRETIDWALDQISAVVSAH